MSVGERNISHQHFFYWNGLCLAVRLILVHSKIQIAKNHVVDGCRDMVFDDYL